MVRAAGYKIHKGAYEGCRVISCMKKFLDENFLLNNSAAITLFHQYAENMPIIDYHCHLDVREIAENKRYRNITELWLGGDHYKWKALRMNGVEEKFITGDASDWDKFLRWAETIPKCLGNPLYHWTHLELRRYFGIEKLLSAETASLIWDRCNSRLKEDGFTARGLIERSNVKALCTTEDPADTLEYHKRLAADSSFNVRVLPAMRPDNALNLDAPGFADWVGRMAEASGIDIKSYADLKKALVIRMDQFRAAGCRLSDHGLEPPVFCKGTEEEATESFEARMAGETLTEAEVQKYKTRLIVFLGREYCRRNWSMQLHIGAMRNNSARMLKRLGTNAGFDSIGDSPLAVPVSRLLDALDETNELPKTILYCLNPADNEVIASLAGCFEYGGVPAKIQFGSGWWYNDQKDGIVKQLTALANMGLLSRFVGMLTDSRSFISYTRHEYFRRVLCDLVGAWAEAGEVPDDIELLGGMVQDICYNNARDFFEL